MKRHNLRAELHAALDKLREINPNGYGQLLLLPFGAIPAYAQDDNDCLWWCSEEAKERLATIREAIEEAQLDAQSKAATEDSV